MQITAGHWLPTYTVAPRPAPAAKTSFVPLLSLEQFLKGCDMSLPRVMSSGHLSKFALDYRVASFASVCTLFTKHSKVDAVLANDSFIGMVLQKVLLQ